MRWYHSAKNKSLIIYTKVSTTHQRSILNKIYAVFTFQVRVAIPQISVRRPWPVFLDQEDFRLLGLRGQEIANLQLGLLLRTDLKGESESLFGDVELGRTRVKDGDNLLSYIK